MQDLRSVIQTLLTNNVDKLTVGEVAAGVSYLLETQDDDSAQMKTMHDKMKDVVSQWQNLENPASPTIPNDDPSGLIPLMKKLATGSVSDLTDEDMKLSLACHRLLSGKKTLFNEEKDYLNSLSENLGGIVEASETMGIEAWAAHLSDGAESEIEEVDEVNLNKRTKRSFKSLAGIERPVIGRLCKASGSIVIRGDVPDDCIVMADRGSVTVEGYIFGSVLAVGDINVKENISGLAISKEGDIRCRKVLGESFIVAKSGTVSATEIVRADLLFGGQEITVKGPAHGAEMIAPSITINGETRNCTLQVLENLYISRIIVLEGVTSYVVLRRELSPADYHEPLGADCVALRNRVFSMVSKRKRHIKYALSCVKEMDNTAHRCLVYVLGGEAFTPELQKMEVLEERLLFIEGTLTGLEDFEYLVMDRVRLLMSVTDGNEQGIEATSLEVERELKAIAARLEGIPDDDLKRTLNLFAVLRERMTAYAADPVSGAMDVIVGELERNLTEWRMEKEAIEASITEMTDSMNKLGQMKVLERQEGKYIQVLQKFAKSKLVKADEDMSTRLSSVAAKRLLKSIGSCQNNLRNYKEQISGLSQELDAAMIMLKDKYKYSLTPLDEANPEGASAEGIFDSGVIFATSKNLVEDARMTGSKRVLVVTGSDESRRFVRSGDTIVEAHSDFISE